MVSWACSYLLCTVSRWCPLSLELPGTDCHRIPRRYNKHPLTLSTFKDYQAKVIWGLALPCVLKSLMVSKTSVYRTVAWSSLCRACFLAGVCNTALWIVFLFPAPRYPYSPLGSSQRSLHTWGQNWSSLGKAANKLELNFCDTVRFSSVVF